MFKKFDVLSPNVPAWPAATVCLASPAPILYKSAAYCASVACSSVDFKFSAPFETSFAVCPTNNKLDRGSVKSVRISSAFSDCFLDKDPSA